VSPRIRPATAADDTALHRLDVVTWSPDVSPAPRPPAARPFFRAGDRPGDVLVAEVDGAVTGYVKLGATTELESNRHVFAIWGLAVDPAYQGRGLGRALLDAAAREAAARGARRLTLRVHGPNAAARALYAACGFTEEGVLRGEFHLAGRDVDDVLMARAL
jgi:ribosomal protein S18 acetylase RimI-like enzyme